MTVGHNLYGLGLEQGVNRLVNYNPLWPRAFADEAARIRSALGPLAVAIEHYGIDVVDLSQVNSSDYFSHSKFVEALPELQEIAATGGVAGGRTVGGAGAGCC